MHWGHVYIFSVQDSQGFVCQEGLSVQLPANETQQELLPFLFCLRTCSGLTVRFTCRAALVEVLVSYCTTGMMPQP